MWHRLVFILMCVGLLGVLSGCQGEVENIATASTSVSDITPDKQSSEIRQELLDDLKEVHSILKTRSSKDEDLTKYEMDFTSGFIDKYSQEDASSAPEKVIVLTTQMAYLSYTQHIIAIKHEGAPLDNKYKEEFNKHLKQLEFYLN